MTATLPVDEEQIFAAKLLIEFEGGPDKVDPLIVAIANAESASSNGQKV
jgi:hypothetical protein